MAKDDTSILQKPSAWAKATWSWRQRERKRADQRQRVVAETAKQKDEEREKQRKQAQAGRMRRGKARNKEREQRRQGWQGAGRDTSKAAKNTRLPQKNSFFWPVFFWVFFSPFPPGRCAGPARAFWVKFCVFNGKFREYFRNFHHFLYGLRKY
jgi:hypothetical protein